MTRMYTIETSNRLLEIIGAMVGILGPGLYGLRQLQVHLPDLTKGQLEFVGILWMFPCMWLAVRLLAVSRYVAYLEDDLLYLQKRHWWGWAKYAHYVRRAELQAARLRHDRTGQTFELRMWDWSEIRLFNSVGVCRSKEFELFVQAVREWAKPLPVPEKW